MSLVYTTTLTPSKESLLAAWLPTQSWFTGDAAQLTIIDQYRFDDPAGDVGIQGFVLRAGTDTLTHVVLSYRGAELPEAASSLVGTMQHGVLGTRWVYDGAGDPVVQQVLRAAITRGERSAEVTRQLTDGTCTEVPQTMQAQGSGAGDDADALLSGRGDAQGQDPERTLHHSILRVLRVPTPARDTQAGAARAMLTATWREQSEPYVLATLERTAR